MENQLEKTIVDKLIEQQIEISELKRGLGDILLVILDAEKGIKHKPIKNSNETVGLIIKKLQEKVNG